MQYRKKPVVVEAFQTTNDFTDLPDWIHKAMAEGIVRLIQSGIDYEYVFEIKTLEGIHRSTMGDYIIQGVKGEIYPCKPDIFAATYEVV
jgi:hypothetical protein